VATISARQLADLVPCSLDDVRRLQELGLLVSEDGRYESAAVHLVRLMDAFEEAGVSLEDVARGVAAGELSFPLALFMPELAARSTTFEMLCAADAEFGLGPRAVRRPAHLEPSSC
jgi:hypothetical protein